ncbi:tRNA pseudouridine(38-40) synthase TruA [Anaeromicrobium sediminis]|uniref:tRNA pseudouridine synthase A n=1 Tax=Anaeromicrobium sediminis TaxID=1478221 RepID=A0A267M8L9_9FIRM|nr:tRNA pseudouridine(38-40) synthase TruA [Anaeromicrobium sediminis]PAB55921.1 tRNA pseudouridine(38-40) synthase TruA [Anaeromicrobium sediminis]
MNNYKMIVAYDGRRYKGWKRETGDSADKSIQGKLEGILSKLYKRNIEVIGAVNTDAGVHALGQVANFKAPDIGLNEKEIHQYIEEYLTEDIVVKSLEKVNERFHSRLKIKEITYQYRLWKKDSKDILLFERYQTYKLKEILNINDMQVGAEKLVGKHDFAAFTNKGKNKNTIKELIDVNIEETDNEILINITGNSFLVNMERFIVGTLIQIGSGQKKVRSIDNAFSTLEKEYVGHKAMAHSLCLMKVLY